MKLPSRVGHEALRHFSVPRAARIALVAATAGLSSCGPPCPAPTSVSQALEQRCVLMPDGGGDQTSCTPSVGTICTVIGTGQAGWGDEGVSGARTRMYSPMDVTIAPDGLVYFVDWNNHRIRRLSSMNVVTSVAGSGELNDGDSTPDSMPMRAPEPALLHRLNHPTAVAFDRSGRLLIAAWHNSMIKRVDLRTGILEPLYGTGARSFGGDGMNAYDARFDLPCGVAVSPTGDVYIADQANQRVRRVDAMGIVTTVVGTGMAGFSGDGGPAAMAQLNNPVGQAASPAGKIEFDANGNLFIADTGNHRIRRVTSAGVISTVAGNGTTGTMGDGGPAVDAQLNAPADVAIGSDGTVFIADTASSCVRAVDPAGTIRTVAGRCGMRGFSGDGGSPEAALLDRPYGVAVDAQGNLWVADTHNHRVRLVCLHAGGTRCAAAMR